MTSMSGQAPTSITLEGSILRADGTIEELGVLAYTNRNPIRRIMGQRHVRGSSPLRALLGRAPRISDKEK